MFENEERIRLAFQNVFRHPDGYIVLAIIRHELGANCTDPDKIKPDLIAFDHWLLNKIGIKHVKNFEEEAKALLGIANDNDIFALKQRAAEQEARKNEDH